MKRKNRFLVFLFAAPVVFFGCYSTEVNDSKNVAQDQIFHKYRLFYNDEAGEISVEAIFRFGSEKGTTLHLSSPSKIKVNGVELRGDKEFLRGYVYNYDDLQDNEDHKFTFDFTDYHGKTFKNSLKIHPVSLEKIPEKIKIAEDFSLQVDGNAPPEERMVCQLIHQDSTNYVITGKLISKDTFLFSAGEMKKMLPGPANFQITMTNFRSLDEISGAGGWMMGRYISKKYPVRILE